MSTDLLFPSFPIADFQDGSLEAYNALFGYYYKPLCFFAKKLLNRTDLAEDMVREAYIKLWNRRTDFDHIQKIKSFLYTTVRNACLNELRHRKVKNSYEIDYQSNPDNHIDDSTISHLIQAELIHAIYEEIAAMPEKRRQVFNYLYIDGLRMEEIARQMGISVFTVKEHKSKALAHLRLKFKDHHLILFLLYQSVMNPH
jgi:RNA polymerase sigma-70 factor (family 1)